MWPHEATSRLDDDDDDKDNSNDNDKDEDEDEHDDDDDDDDGAEKEELAAGRVCLCVACCVRMKNIFLISCHQYQMKCYNGGRREEYPLLPNSLTPLFAALTAL